jgi:tRNA modification GTPase
VSDEADTIYALSSGGLPAGVAVVRVSGSRVRAVVEGLCGTLPEPRKAVLRTLFSPEGEVLDTGLVLFFPSPKSFTGEDVAEFHLHGGKAVVARFLEELSGFFALRPAVAGEFTRRAFVNGQMDLTEAEGLADLVAVETEMQRRLALSGAHGAQKALYDGWRDKLLHARAMLEAEFDFSDEGDIPGSVFEAMVPELRQLGEEIHGHLASTKAMEIIRDGFRIVLVGVPNSGKSSLLNALAKREVAIVTEEAGTTRDVIEVSLDLDGYKVIVSDTAGIREAEGLVEKIGIGRTRQAMGQADLVVVLVPPDGALPDIEPDLLDCALLVHTKADLLSTEATELSVSVHSGEGLSELIDLIKGFVKASTVNGQSTVGIQDRHLSLLRATEAALCKAIACWKGHPEIAAEHLRQASHELGRITGRVDVEDLLDVIFSRFCIGK